MQCYLRRSDPEQMAHLQRPGMSRAESGHRNLRAECLPETWVDWKVGYGFSLVNRDLYYFRMCKDQKYQWRQNCRREKCVRQWR